MNISKRLTYFVLASAALISSAIHAGEIYGKVSLNGAAVGEGVEVTPQCAGKTYPTTKTDKTGTYNLVIADAGKCTLTVKHKDKSATLSVASYDDAAQADIVLEDKDGKLTARRR